MKKSLIALAALAATGAFAQSTVQIVGTFDPSFANQTTTYGNGASVTQNKLLNNAQGTSQITFKGTEDLGGGLKANFLFENDFDTAKDANNGTGSTASFGNFGSKGGEQFLNLEGGFGKIALGAANTPSLTTQSSSQPFGTKIGSGFGAANTGRVRNGNTIVYTSPVVAGFTFAAAYAPQSKVDAGTLVTATTSVDATKAQRNEIAAGAIADIGLMYANGPLSAGVTAYSVEAVTATTPASSVTQAISPSKNTQTNAYVKYDLGVATLGFGYYTEKQDVTGVATPGLTANITKLDSTAYNIGAWVPLNANLSLLGSYTKKDDKTTLNFDRTVTAVGIKYTLSKMTSVYARYVEDKIENVAATASQSAKKTTTGLVGMQTNF